MNPAGRNPHGEKEKKELSHRRRKKKKKSIFGQLEAEKRLSVGLRELAIILRKSLVPNRRDSSRNA